MLSFVPVRVGKDQERLACLASQVWHEYWPALIGDEQTDYMVELFLSPDAIRRDMAENGYEYWFLVAGDAELSADEAAKREWGHIVGFTGGHVEPETNRFFISKIYLLADARGHHFASRVTDFYEALCRARDLRAMYLTVNKHNELGVRAYEGNGFLTINKVETDIGHGFVMDDFVMERPI